MDITVINSQLKTINFHMATPIRTLITLINRTHSKCVDFLLHCLALSFSSPRGVIVFMCAELAYMAFSLPSVKYYQPSTINDDT